MWEKNPRILRPSAPSEGVSLLDAPGARPYIAEVTPERFVWRDSPPVPGEIALLDNEVSYALPRVPAGGVLIEPGLKAKASPNKRWGHWQAVVDARPGIPWVQIGAPGTEPPLKRVTYIMTPSFRIGCGVLSGMSLYVGHEGGLHHAAAALGVPAVVLFGGYISPAQTGYLTHWNLFTGGEPCGSRYPCLHCADAMRRITVEMVVETIDAALQGRVASGRRDALPAMDGA
jgi:hypothetical protein